MKAMERSGAAVHVTGLRHSYQTQAGSLDVLRDGHLEIPAGGHCALQGPSGAGKTTLLALLGGLTPPQAGTIRIGDAELASLGSDEMATYRRETVGFVFQHFGLLET